jgi:hypothetical protein
MRDRMKRRVIFDPTLARRGSLPFRFSPTTRRIESYTEHQPLDPIAETVVLELIPVFAN